MNGRDDLCHHDAFLVSFVGVTKMKGCFGYCRTFCDIDEFRLEEGVWLRDCCLSLLKAYSAEQVAAGSWQPIITHVQTSTRSKDHFLFFSITRYIIEAYTQSKSFIPYTLIDPTFILYALFPRFHKMMKRRPRPDPIVLRCHLEHVVRKISF